MPSLDGRINGYLPSTVAPSTAPSTIATRRHDRCWGPCMTHTTIVLGAGPPEGFGSITAYGLVTAIILGVLASAAIAVVIALASSAVQRTRHRPRLR
jgi:hypothetical protein